MTPPAHANLVARCGPQSSLVCFYVTAAVVAALDQLTKLLAVHHLALGTPAPFLGSVASLTLTHNRGSAMSLVPGGSHVLAAVGAVVAVVLVIWGPRFARTGLAAWWGLSLLLGGALGNMVDRVRLGYVVDFVDFHFWPVFNVADIAVVCGAGLLVVAASARRPEAPGPEQE